MLLTLLLSPIISPDWPVLLAVVIVLLLPFVGLGLLVRGIWLLSKGERSASWLMIGLGCLLLPWFLARHFNEL